MTILVKKVFISSKPTFVYLLCPPLCGPFSIQESAAGGLSYKVKNRKIRQNPRYACPTGFLYMISVRSCPRIFHADRFLRLIFALSSVVFLLLRHILCHLIDELGHADAILDRLVQHKEDLRGVPKIYFFCQLGSDKALRTL